MEPAGNGTTQQGNELLIQGHTKMKIKPQGDFFISWWPKTICPTIKEKRISSQTQDSINQQTSSKKIFKNQQALPTNSKLEMATALTFLALSIFQLVLAISAQQTAGSCPCKYDQKFKSCQIRNHKTAWMEHYDPEVGLYEDCLPQVQEK